MRGTKAHISVRSYVLIYGGTAALLGFVALGVMFNAHPQTSTPRMVALLTDTGNILFDLIAAAALLYTASHFQKGTSLRRVWLLMGLGIAAYAGGDVIWTVLEATRGFVPYPSLADGAYLTMYALMGVGLFQAALVFRRVAKLDVVVAVDTLLMFGIAVLTYVFIGAPIIVDKASSIVEKVLGVAYPLGDLGALLAPAIFIAFVATIMRRAQPVRQWWALAAGLAIMSFADIAFTWLDWTGHYASGNPIDYLWMLGLLLIAVGGSLAGDVCLEHRYAAALAAKPAH